MLLFLVHPKRSEGSPRTSMHSKELRSTLGVTNLLLTSNRTLDRKFGAF